MGLRKWSNSRLFGPMPGLVIGPPVSSRPTVGSTVEVSPMVVSLVLQPYD